jgi:translation initiation factor IF-1
MEPLKLIIVDEPNPENIELTNLVKETIGRSAFFVAGETGMDVAAEVSKCMHDHGTRLILVNDAYAPGREALLLLSEQASLIGSSMPYAIGYNVQDIEAVLQGPYRITIHQRLAGRTLLEKIRPYLDIFEPYVLDELRAEVMEES